MLLLKHKLRTYTKTTQLCTFVRITEKRTARTRPQINTDQYQQSRALGSTRSLNTMEQYNGTQIQWYVYTNIYVRTCSSTQESANRVVCLTTSFITAQSTAAAKTISAGSYVYQYRHGY